MAKNKHRRTAKTVLKLPDLEQSKSTVMNSLTSASSKRSYDHAIREFIGRRFYAQGDLGTCEGKREKLWLGNDRTARLAPDLCTTMPSGGRRAGTNSVPAGPCLSADDRAIPRVQAAVSRCSQ